MTPWKTIPPEEEECVACGERSKGKKLCIHVCNKDYEIGGKLMYNLVHAMRKAQSEINKEEPDTTQ